VNDFQQVKEGDLLVEIEDNDYGARLAQAEAELAGAEAAIANLKSRKALQHSQIAEAQEAINATQADVERTRKEAVRQKALLASTFGTPQKVEQAVAGFHPAQLWLLLPAPFPDQAGHVQATANRRWRL
jgi:membrane fusion protein (multidrug efflux system)